MAISPTRQAEVQALIVQGLDIRAIYEKTRISRATIYKMKEEMHRDAEAKHIEELSKASPAIVAEVARGVKARTPLALESEVTKIVNSVESIQKLEVNFHKTFDNILDKANTMMEKENLSVIDWQIITGTLANAFKEIYNSKGTTINVANADNVAGNQNSLSMFQGRM